MLVEITCYISVLLPKKWKGLNKEQHQMRFKFLKPIILGFLLIIGLNANAAIISGLETHTTSDGSVVNLSGLDWLSWDETRGERRNDVEGGDFLASGWRYASIDEYEALMSSVWDVYNGYSTDNNDGGQWVFDNMFGSSRLPGWTSNSMLTGMLYGSEDECETVDRSCRGKFSLYSNDWRQDSVNITASFTKVTDFNGQGQTYGDFSVQPYDASALVRTAPVPEPSTLAIFVLGIMCLASRRFKK